MVVLGLSKVSVGDVIYCCFIFGVWLGSSGFFLIFNFLKVEFFFVYYLVEVFMMVLDFFVFVVGMFFFFGFSLSKVVFWIILGVLSSFFSFGFSYCWLGLGWGVGVSFWFLNF